MAEGESHEAQFIENCANLMEVLGIWVAIPGFASIPGGFVGDRAPRYSFLSIAGLDLECQPTFKCFLQQICYLQPFLGIRQEGTKIVPFVRVSWARVPSLLHAIRDAVNKLKCCVPRVSRQALRHGGDLQCPQDIAAWGS